MKFTQIMLSILAGQQAIYGLLQAMDTRFAQHTFQLGLRHGDFKNTFGETFVLCGAPGHENAKLGFT
jgi:hypothetical protein